MQYPHCDQDVLHAPEDGCKYCNLHPDWQELRIMNRICFTGHDPTWMTEHYGPSMFDGWGMLEWVQCPAEQRRPIESINRWGGNVPFTPKAEAKMQSYYDKLHEDIIAEWDSNATFDFGTFNPNDPRGLVIQQDGGSFEPDRFHKGWVCDETWTWQLNQPAPWYRRLWNRFRNICSID